MDDDHRPALSRRTVLAGSGAGAVVAALAACSGGASTGTRGGTAAADAVLARTSDVPVGGALAVDVEGAPVLVTQPEEGTFAAFSAICTHQGCTVGPDDGELVCPCHASRFDLATGEVLGGPASERLPPVRVVVDGGAVTTA